MLFSLLQTGSLVGVCKCPTNGFLDANHPNVRLRVIPHPSETRWLFYRDIVNVIISQKKFVELFVSTERDFPAFWNRVRNDKVTFGKEIDQDFPFNSPFIKAAFSFASEILHILGIVNTVFQE